MRRSFLAPFSFLAAALWIGFSPVLPVSAQEVLDGIAAVVNDEVITFSQVRELTGAKERSISEAARGAVRSEELMGKIAEIRKQAISDLVDRQLILQEFKKNKFQIPDHFIEDRVNTITREEFGGDRSAFLRTLAAQGYSMERFRQMETEKMIVQSMRQQAVKSETKVPEAQIEEYYRSHVADYSTPEQLKLRMITIRKGDEGGENRKKLIEEIRQKITKGAKFGDLAKLYSEDSNQEAGGDWGWIDRKTLNEALTKAAFSLKAGQVSEVVSMESSYYLLFAEAKKDAATRPLAELRDEIERKLIQEERQKRQQAWLAKLRKKAYVKLF
jgi:peptidyl-prolyl cis-trans isomerase SurA